MLPKRKDTQTFLPIVKFDARHGKFTRVDRVQIGRVSSTKSQLMTSK